MDDERPSCIVDHTLQKKRILCLHGGGTNARIFRAQCRALERKLKPHFVLCYAEAPFASQPGPDVVSVYKDWGPYKAWLRWRLEDPNRDENSAIEHITRSLVRTMAEDDEKGRTGEWVGLLGFSQGAKICASLLYMQQIHKGLCGMTGNLQSFRFAVLLAGRGPLVSLGPDKAIPPGLVSASAISTVSFDEKPNSTATILLEIPTIHLHGLQDPGLQLHRRLLSDYFDRRQARLQEWNGGHRVPIKTTDVDPLVQEIISIAKMTGAISTLNFEHP